MVHLTSKTRGERQKSFPKCVIMVLDCEAQLDKRREKTQRKEGRQNWSLNEFDILYMR